MLRETILNAVKNPINAADNFDIHGQLKALLKEFNLSPEDSGGDIKFIGSDPIIPSPIRFGAATGLALTAKAVAIAKLWKLRTGDGQDIEMDLRRAPHRLSPFFQGKWEKINGFPPGFPLELSNPFAGNFYKTKDDRHVLPMCFYHRLRLSALKILNAPEDHDAIAAEIRKWTADELEEKFNAAGLPLTKARSVEEFLATGQFEVLQHMPLVEIEKIGDTAPIPFSPNPKTPLDGVKALGMGHIIAGAGTGRALALHGADVLNIWSVKDVEWESLYATADVGMRSAKLDLNSEAGKAKMTELTKDADVFFANRRKGYLDKNGLSAEEMAKVNPGIIHVSFSLYGLEGPWADRFGFDVSGGAAAGVNVLEGTLADPAFPAIKVVNDFIASWLASTAIVSTLIRRSQEGGSYKIHISLTRAILWMFTLGFFDKEYALLTAGSTPEHSFLDPELFTAETPLGTYQGVTEQVHMSKTPGSYKYALVPRCANKAEWDS
jgi:crotonobetainyl-CoA:carnitine CoA-transferase CaiB-like acyl-CoA transferase